MPAAGHRTPAADAQPPTPPTTARPPQQLKASSSCRYKFVVQVVIGETAARASHGVPLLWDAETDNYAEDTYRNAPRRAPPQGSGRHRRHIPTPARARGTRSSASRPPTEHTTM